MRVGLTVSIVLHTTLYLCAILLTPTIDRLPQGGKGDQQTEGKGQSEASKQKSNGNIVAPEHLEAMELTPQVKKAIAKQALKDLPKPKAMKKAPCSSYYGGIGIYQRYGAVSDIVPGYPASRTGLQVGDIMLEDPTGYPGTEVTIRVMRNGEYLSFQTVRAKICVTRQKD